MELQLLEKSLEQEHTLSNKITQAMTPKQSRGESSFSNYLKNIKFGKPLLAGNANAQSAEAFLSSALFPASQSGQEHAKDKTLSFHSTSQSRSQNRSQEQNSELARKKQKEEEDSFRSLELSERENLKAREGLYNTQESAEYNSRKKQSDIEESSTKKTEQKDYGKKNKNKTEGQKLREEALNESIHSQKQVLAKDLEAFLKELSQKGEARPSHKKDLENIETKQLQSKEGLDTETLVRVSLEPEKWRVQHSSDLQEKKNGEQKQDRLSSLKASEEGKGKYFGKNKEENAQNNKDGQSANSNSPSHSIEELALLFNKEGHQADSLKSFQNNMRKESVLRETKDLYNELVKKAKLNLKTDGSSSASIRMRPRSLGNMTLNLEIFQKQVQAQIVVESQAVKQILLEELNYFQQELQKQGIQVESLNIRVRENLESQTANEQEAKSEDQETEQEQNSAMHKKGQGNKRDGEFAEHRQEKDMETESASVLSISAEEYETSALSLSESPREKHIDVSV